MIRSNLPSKESCTIEGFSDEEQFSNKLDPMNKKEITVAMDKNSMKRKSVGKSSKNVANKNSPQLREFEKFIQKGEKKIAKFTAKRGSSHFDMIRESGQGVDSPMHLHDPCSLLAHNRFSQQNPANRSVTHDISRQSITHPKSVHSKSTHGQAYPADKETANDFLVSDAVITELGTPSPHLMRANDKHLRSSRLNQDITELMGTKK